MRRIPTSLAFPLLALALLLAPAAPAQPKLGDDEVSLKNGGVVRGTVIELEPGKHVLVFVDLTGERRLLTWEEVARVERGKFAPGALPGGAPAAAAPRGELGLVRLRISTDDQRLRLFGETSPEAPLCLPPCDQVVDGRAGQEFWYGGEGLSRSEAFKLTARQGDLEMRVKSGSSTWRMVGAVGGIAGLGIGYIGAMVLAVSTLDAGYRFDSGHVFTADERRTLRITGAVMLPVGVALALGGLYAVLTNATTWEVVPPKAPAK